MKKVAHLSLRHLDYRKKTKFPDTREHKDTFCPRIKFFRAGDVGCHHQQQRNNTGNNHCNVLESHTAVYKMSPHPLPRLSIMQPPGRPSQYPSRAPGFRGPELFEMLDTIFFFYVPMPISSGRNVVVFNLSSKKSVPWR